MSYKTYDKHMSICTSYMNKHKPLDQTLADYIVFTVTKLASNTLYNTNTMFCNSCHVCSCRLETVSLWISTDTSTLAPH